MDSTTLAIVVPCFLAVAGSLATVAFKEPDFYTKIWPSLMGFCFLVVIGVALFEAGLSIALYVAKEFMPVDKHEALKVALNEIDRWPTTIFFAACAMSMVTSALLWLASSLSSHRREQERSTK